ncbi:flagellar hook-basal body complex protein FliE [Neorhizobium galegae]|uniref:Flagellar hook-basal body complex protein FliE n=1 Tax=Neorhizobium galegae bv. officinalis TaxID=323656 RepID=A0A0T7GB53_NEOGA|nr:flagellar hook-basal body complex protein FliE [Neorhizobium galegae]CDZ44327.1 Flagellar hook-basal body complex protein FliE [Neorhizobium galegae bv. officinalis]
MIDKIQNLSSLSLTNGLDEVGSASSSTFAGGIATTPGQNTGMDFGSIMANMATDTMNSLKGAESMSFKAIQGKANTREVVDAVLEAQQSLQTAMALRDKIVSAYLEVTKMQI